MREIIDDFHRITFHTNLVYYLRIKIKMSYLLNSNGMQGAVCFIAECMQMRHFKFLHGFSKYRKYPLYRYLLESRASFC